MQLQDKYRIAILSAYALGLHGFESLLPSPIPWLRLGLANIITITTLFLYGTGAAVTVTLIRVVLGSLFAGTFPGPAFILSLGGGLASALVMGSIFSVAPRLFSAIGLSIIGALFHNLVQLVIAYFLFIQKIEAVLLITPLMVLLGTLTGTANGAVSGLLIKNLKISGQKVQNVD